MSELVQEAYKNFISSVDSEKTKQDYRYGIQLFMKFCNTETYEQLLQIEQKKLEGIIRDYIIHMKVDKKLSSNSISLYVASISHFYQMNDVVLNWRKLNKFKGKKRTVVDDRPYTRQEIKQLLDFADLRMKCIILLSSSAGLRRGAIPILRLGDLKKIDKYNLYQITIYKKESECYITYCTPECSIALEEYFKWRARLGEVLTPKSPVIRLEFDTRRHLEISKSKPITLHAMDALITKLLDNSGLRARGQKHEKTEIMRWHGFRKYWDTTATKSGMDIYISEKLMGHSVGLKERYTKLSDEDLLEGNDRMRGYISAINDLTINEEFRLKEKVKELTIKKDRFDTLLEEVDRLKTKLGFE